MAKQKEQRGTKAQETKEQGSQSMQTTGGQSGGQQSSQQTGLARREQTAQGIFGGNPFTFMRRFSEEMDRLFEDFGFRSGWLTPSFGRNLPSAFGDLSQGMWAPQVEMFEREGQLVVRADLPGLTKDDVKVEVADGAVTISGERRNENEEKGEGYYRTERSYGSFYRQIPLPEGVNADDASATFRNGVLEVTMKAPERAKERSRRLEIKGGPEEEPRARAQAAGQGRS
ncbi:MAG: Hsp20/alpha crystallin family protein [Acidobacteriota bacterium]|nr:Hsp20/alpha crystallin family protein [Acidobacteriota bacterium]